ncbi:DNA cross-link repair 1A protein [Gadus morhua]|uniref:DNA cross-link repair 1A (PSO2 homolog, S. cerevisiae) n=1 Tax=Gadus morhua TaxID=8049 RepID=A0A8C5CB10_GADMO|nr:DNA cross-link repair 1A protein [Gadus morhua]
MPHTDDSEDDIWEYKPLRKKKKTASASHSKKTSKKNNCSSSKSDGSISNGHVSHTSINITGSINKGHVLHKSVNHTDSIRNRNVPHTSVNKSSSIMNGNVPHTSVNNTGSIRNGNVPHTSLNHPVSISHGDFSVINLGQSDQEAATASHTLCPHRPEPTGDGASESDFCPICQMPFSILVGKSEIGHVTECLDIPRDDTLECPDGIQCSSNVLNHYRRYNHTLLAQSRAANASVLFSLTQAGETPRGSGVRSPSPLESSQDIFSSSLPNPRCHLASTPTRLACSQSNTTASPVGRHLASTPTRNSLLLLRSPRPEDFKKKKGWMTPKGPKTKVAVEKTKTTVSSRPCDANGQPGSLEAEKQPDKPEVCPFDDESISFSPLSELPAELELEDEVEGVVEGSGLRKALFPPSLAEENEDESEESLELFSDDDFLNDFLDHLETDMAPERGAEQANSPVNSTQVEAVFSLAAPSNQPSHTAAVGVTPTSTHRETHGNPAATNVQSPQSVVLERLRQSLTGSNSLLCQSVSNINNNYPTLGSSQTASSTSTQAMAPRKPALSQMKAGQGPGLKQTDIGVFFGLKPLKEKQGEPGSASQDLEAATTTAPDAPTFNGAGIQRGSTRGRRGRGNRGARSGAAGPTGARADAGTGSAEGGGPGSGSAQGEGSRGGRGRGRGRGRWNRWGADRDGPRHCPFYKKIPGTGFAIDAFNYGQIEGIFSYFLTHFHSDHYGGLTKKSTFPIYCNKITGNLVRSKLKVEEKYLHILPMNSRVTVDGVGVILMEANHCPGAAMLLFFLPDGQIVLHTGDFRADPTMETPELRSYGVQTLYLDTTYCSPEYTFPRQQEAISFAANTAFELVALHPRTLVVCGSYSIGKEKVFLALADALGSNVCLSRDKYNTMCCLESEPIRKLLTTDWKAAQVHVLPMMQLNVKKLQDHLSRFSAQYDRLVAFKPTGWTFSKQMDSVDDIRPQIYGNITLYGVPYSEHSSFLEMKRFVQWLRPLKIIPTVNAGSWASRKAMEGCFRDWLAGDKASH